MFLGIAGAFIACFNFSGHVKNYNNVVMPNSSSRMSYQVLSDSSGNFDVTSDYLFVESYSFSKSQIQNLESNNSGYKFYVQKDGNDYFYFQINNFALTEGTSTSDISFNLSQNQLGNTLRERFNFDIEVYASYGSSAFDDSDIDPVHTYFRFFSSHQSQQLNFLLEDVSNSWVTDQSLQISFVYHVYDETIFNLFDLDDTYENGYGDGYNSGYVQGVSDGYNEGYYDYIDSEGYQNAIDNANQSGFNRGYNEGINTQTYTFGQLFGAIADTPIMIMYNLLGFDVFGVSALSIVMSMLTGCIVLFLIKKIIL